jgi:Ca2+/H+ antiporter
VLLAVQVLAFLASEASASPDAVLGMCMRLGEVNFKVMALLDDAHTSRWVMIMFSFYGCLLCCTLQPASSLHLHCSSNYFTNR